MRDSVQRMGRGRMDLMQVHNLVDWRTQRPVLREWTAAGRIRYVGVTRYSSGSGAYWSSPVGSSTSPVPGSPASSSRPTSSTESCASHWPR